MQAKITPQTARRHREAGCDLHRHRSYRALAKCVWPWAYWIDGEGPWASVARCGVTTIQLHSTAASAEAAQGLIDSTGCGGHCRRDHHIFRLYRADER